MESKEKEMLERLKPERHRSAMMTLATIKYIKEECKRNIACEYCKFYGIKNVNWAPCYFCGVDVNPTNWDEYELVERIYK